LNVIVSGANGWLGRSSLWSLSTIEKINRIVPVTRNKMNFKVSEYEFNSVEYKDFNLNFSIDGFIHLPFVTRDKVATQSNQSYINENLKLISWALKVIKIYKPKWIISISSGAVYKNGNNLSTELEVDLGSNPYGFLKHIEEKLIQDESKNIKANYVCGRLWGAMGEDIQNYKPYAIGDFVSSALKDKVIEVKASNDVRRNFVDTRQFMTILILEAMAGNDLTIDSFGNEISIRDLALKVGENFKGSKVIFPKEFRANESDNYTPLKDDFLQLYLKWDIEKMNIEEQIKVTIKGIEKLLGRDI
jgi:nucleoside-diphosphate-sugar epimerase